MSEPLLTSAEITAYADGILKKDDSARIVEAQRDYITIEADDLDAQIEEALEEDEPMTTLDQEGTGLPLTPAVRIARAIFMVHSGVSLLFVFFGIIPYYFFRADVSVKGLEWMFFAACFICFGFYVWLALLRDPFYIVPMMSVWLFALFLVMTCMAAMMRNLLPFQAAAIHFCQGLGMLVYCFVSHRELNPMLAACVMFGWGCIAWMLGLYAFIHYNDWILSFVLFLLCVVGSSVYSAYQVKLLGRWNLSRRDHVLAVQHFYIDLIELPGRWIVERLSTRGVPSSDESSPTLTQSRDAL